MQQLKFNKNTKANREILKKKDAVADELLTKKEIKFLKAEEEREAKEKEALEEEQRKAEEEKNKLTRSEELLVEIRDLLAKK